jgi:maleylacetate reductase
VLPHAIAYNADAAPEAMSALANALGQPDPAAGVYRMLGELGLERSLARLGMPQEGIDRAARAAVREPYPNPAPLDQARIGRLLTAAWAGDPPAA